ncbi:MAG: hypothetical protein R3E98_07195 [Gemmatimonadota bacterium]|nr:hypothetical protein [Gemmatimonadota bacterium]
MRILVSLVAALNLWFGVRAALNVLGILQTSKYGTPTTVLAALLGLGLGGYGAWLAWMGKDLRHGLLVGLAPWVLGVVVVFISLVVGDPR